MQKKYKIMLGGVFVIIIMAMIAGAMKNNQEKGASGNKNNTHQADEAFENNVIVQSDDATDKIDIGTGTVAAANAVEKEDFSEFAGLPKMGMDGTRDIEQGITIISNDKSKAIVTVVDYALEKNENQSVGSQTILKTSEYLCDIAQKKCEASNLFSQEYQGLDKKKSGSIWWLKWDSVKNILYGNIEDEKFGSIAPIYACDTQIRKCNNTGGIEVITDDDEHAIVPEGSFSPSLENFVMIKQHDKINVETGKLWELELYAADNLEKPLKTYDISAIIDRDENVAYDSVKSIAWSGDEKKIAIGTARRIFMFNVESGSLSLAYVAPTDMEGDAYWNSSELFLSPDAKFIAFIDESDEETDAINEEDRMPINVLKKIDLENSNKITELLRGPALDWK